MLSGYFNTHIEICIYLNIVLTCVWNSLKIQTPQQTEANLENWTLWSAASLEKNASMTLKKKKKSTHPPQGGKKKRKEVIWLLQSGVLLGETCNIPEDNPNGSVL